MTTTAIGLPSLAKHEHLHPATAPEDGLKRRPKIPVLKTHRNNTSLGTSFSVNGSSDLSPVSPVSRPTSHRSPDMLLSSQKASRTSLFSLKQSPTHSRRNTNFEIKKPRSKKQSKLGVDTSYLLKLVEYEEELRNKRFKQPGEAVALFRKIARRAMICLNWVSSILKIRTNFLEQQLEVFNDQSKDFEQALFDKQMEMAGTVFNKHDFMPKKEFSLGKEVQDILTLPPKFRSKEQVRVAITALQGIKAFTEFPSHVQSKLCQVAWHQRVPAKKVIIRQGHQGLNFYFVVSGRGIIKVVSRRSDGTIMNGEKVVYKVEKGHSFGDIALLHNVERTATVESHTEMSLLVIGRDDFLRIFLQRDDNGRFQPEHFTFLRTVAALKHWPVERLVNCGDNYIFHYFKRGKLIVADSNTSDYLYIVKSGTCEVLKQLKEAMPLTSSQMTIRDRRRIEIANSRKPGIGKRAVSTVPCAFTLPPIPNKVINVSIIDEVENSLKEFVKARQDDPNLMVDIPKILHAQMDELQNELIHTRQSETPALASVVTELLERKRLSVMFAEKKKESIQEEEEEEEAEVQRLPSAKLVSSRSRSPIKSRQSSAKRLTGVRDRDAEEAVNQDRRLRKNSIVSTDDEAYREEYRRTLVRKQSSLAPFNLVIGEDVMKDSESPDSRSSRRTSDDKQPDGFSKSRMHQLCVLWKKSAQVKSDHQFKELNTARELTASPEKLVRTQFERRPSHSTVPEMVEEGVLMMSHEGKQQAVQFRRRSTKCAVNRPPVFVRLALLRPKDVFGLDTLDFDANYQSAKTSVCLVSGGAEVLMINKQFFLAHCSSENLEHLRNIVAPYPKENTMQDNLQVSVDWDVFSQQQLEEALYRMDEKKPLR